jgi:hypothetical protein
LLGLDPSTHEPGGEGIDFLAMGPRVKREGVSWGLCKGPRKGEVGPKGPGGG